MSWCRSALQSSKPSLHSCSAEEMGSASELIGLGVSARTFTDKQEGETETVAGINLENKVLLLFGLRQIYPLGDESCFIHRLLKVLVWLSQFSYQPIVVLQQSQSSLASGYFVLKNNCSSVCPLFLDAAFNMKSFIIHI